MPRSAAHCLLSPVLSPHRLLGVPGIAVITSTTQHAEYAGGDTNDVSQANPADVTVPVFIGK